MSVNVRPTDKQGGGMSTHTPNAPDDTNIIEICSAAGPLVTIKPNGAIEYGEGYTPDGAATIFWQAIAQAFPALRSESGRAGVIEEILTGLRSEDDSTQLRAIIASIEALKPAAGNEGTVRVPRKKLERWLEALQFEQGGEPIGSWTAESIADIKATLSASPVEAKGGEEV
jgi:hypothetical protein